MFDKLKNNKNINDTVGNVSPKHILYIFLFMVIFYFIIWVVIAKKLSWTVISQIDDLRDKKVNVAFDDYRNTGFPFSFATKIKNIIYQNGLKTFELKTDELIIKSSLSDNNKIITQIPNDIFFLRLNGETKDTKQAKYNYQLGIRSQDASMEVLYQNKILKNIYIKSANGVIQTNTSPNTYRYRFFECAIKESNVIIEDEITDILEMNFNTVNIEPPKFWQRILKDNFVSLKGKLYFLNPSYFKELPDFYKFIIRDYDTPEIIVDNITLTHTLSELKLSGLLKFDTDMTLNGNLVLTVSNYKKLLSFLTKKGIISEDVAKNFKYMLSFKQTTQASEKTDHTVDIDLRVYKNSIYQDKVKVFEIKI